MFIAVRAFWIGLHFVEALLAKGAVVTGLSQHTTRHFFAFGAQLR